MACNNTKKYFKTAKKMLLLHPYVNLIITVVELSVSYVTVWRIMPTRDATLRKMKTNLKPSSRDWTMSNSAILVSSKHSRLISRYAE